MDGNQIRNRYKRLQRLERIKKIRKSMCRSSEKRKIPEHQKLGPFSMLLSTLEKRVHLDFKNQDLPREGEEMKEEKKEISNEGLNEENSIGCCLASVGFGCGLMMALIGIALVIAACALLKYVLA